MASHSLLIFNALLTLILCASAATPESPSYYKQSGGIQGYGEKADRQPFPDIIFQNPDTSSTRLVLMPTVNLNVPLAKTIEGTLDLISRWNYDSVTTVGIRNQIVINDNWRIDQQGTHSRGPDGRSEPGVTWANLQIQLGGNSQGSKDRAKVLRKRPQSTSVAEVHAPLGVKFSAKAFQRAFAESKNISRDGGVQVWMYRVERIG